MPAEPPVEPVARGPAITRAHAFSFALGLTVIVLVFAGVGLLIRGPADALGRMIAARLGLTGVLLAVTLAETSPFPLMGEPILLLAREGGLPQTPVVLVGCAANLLASALSYLAGAGLDRAGLVDRILGARRAEAEELVRRQGAWALVIASFTPLPFATLAWTAGALRMPLVPYALATLTRIPKVLITLGVVELGWWLGR